MSGWYLGYLPEQGLTALFLLVVLGFALVLAVVTETLVAGYRAVRIGGSLTDRFATRPLYNAVRVGEVVAAALSVGVFVFVVGTLPDGPMAGPGAIGLLLIFVGLGLLVLGGSLVRTLAEYYYYRTTA